MLRYVAALQLSQGPTIGTACHCLSAHQSTSLPPHTIGHAQTCWKNIPKIDQPTLRKGRAKDLPEKCSREAVSPALGPCLAFSSVPHANLCPASLSPCHLFPICTAFCSLSSASLFCTMLKHWDQETGRVGESQIHLELAAEHRPEWMPLSAARGVALLLTSCSLLFDTWHQSLFSSVVNKSCFFDCEVSVKHSFWDQRGSLPGSEHLVYTPWVM